MGGARQPWLSLFNSIRLPPWDHQARFSFQMYYIGKFIITSLLRKVLLTSMFANMFCLARTDPWAACHWYFLTLGLIFFILQNIYFFQCMQHHTPHISIQAFMLLYYALLGHTIHALCSTISRLHKTKLSSLLLIAYVVLYFSLWHTMTIGVTSTETRTSGSQC